MVELDASLHERAEQLYRAAEQRSPREFDVGEALACLRDSQARLTAYGAALAEREAALTHLREECNSLMEALNSKDQLIASIESSYAVQVQRIQEQTETQLRQLQREHADLCAHHEQLQAELVLERSRAFEQDLHVRAMQVESGELQRALDTLRRENTELRDEIECYRDLRTGSLIINKIYARATNTVTQRDPALYYLLTSKFRNQFLRYFTPDDLGVMMRTSRKLYFLIRANRTLVSHVVWCRTRDL